MPDHLYEILLRRAAAYPEAIAIGGQQGLIWKSLTSSELLATADDLAVTLCNRGVRAGDRVVLWIPNHWRAPAYHFALWKLGAVVVPFDREMNPGAAERILESVEPRLIIVGYGERPSWAQSENVTEWWEPEGSTAADKGDDAWTPPTETLAAVVFTSGTTGNPKGCMITQANLCSQVEALRDNIPLDQNCRLASILPLSHLFELTGGLLYPLSTGAAIHYIPSRRAPDIVRVLSEQRITHMIAVPQLLTIMGNSLDEQLRQRTPGPIYRALGWLAERVPFQARRMLYWPVHRKIGGVLNMMASGGAALPAEAQRLWERLGVRVLQGYGTSECSPVIACGAPDGSTPIGSVGRAIRGTEVRLSSEGELQVSGPNVMLGYWKDPERTAEVLDGGWYSTGDLATIDEAGNVRLAGRAKDLIVMPSGMNIWPQDVEDALRLDTAVQDASVIAVPTPGGGATLHAYLIPTGPQHGSVDLGAVVARANGNLAQHQRVATASWWPESDFPRTSTLKVRRHLLPVPESASSVAVDLIASSDDPVAQAIAGATRVTGVEDRQSLAELGLDSLALVELALALEEKTGRTVADSDLQLDMTVGDVRQLISTAPSVEAAGRAQRRGSETLSAEQPLWPYAWGRIFRTLALPFDLIYRFGATRTHVLGAENLDSLPQRVIFAGTHHGFADISLVRHGIAHSPAKRLAGRIVIAAASGNFAAAGRLAWLGVLAFGIYPLRQYGERDASLRGLARLAESGNAVLIFPQGTHVTPDEERRGESKARFKPGVAHLAGALDAVVVPFGLAGTETIMPPDVHEFHGLVIAGVPVSITRTPLAIAFGQPLEIGADEGVQKFTERVQRASFDAARLAEQALASSDPPD